MAGEAPDFVAWVRTLPCRMRMHDPCDGSVQPHHAGPRPGYAMRAHDNTCIPLCAKHHLAWHDLRRPFLTMSPSARRQWRDAQIAYVQALWEREHGPLP